MDGRVVVIGNPRAGRGTAASGLDDIVRSLREAGMDAHTRTTDAPGAATELARSARSDGAGMVVAVGGDGTVHEVVNGLLAGGAGGDVPVLGVVPTGSGCDYVKTFGIPADVASAVALLVSEVPPLAVDAGEITYRTAEGPRSRSFCNIAEVGIGPEVVARAATLPRRLGGSVYFFGFWLTLPRFVRRPSEVLMDGIAHDGVLMNAVISIGRVFGGGMRITPGADPSDGLFDVQLHLGTKLDYVRAIPKVYKGTHVPHPRVLEARAATVEIRCTPDAVIEADGEVLGTTPATFRVLPAALRLKAPPPA